MIQDTTCMGTQLTTVNDSLVATPGVQALNGVAVWAKIAWQCEGALTLAAAIDTAEQVLDFLDQVVETETAAAGCGDVLLPRWRSVLFVAVVSSIDPNDKLGPIGTVHSQQNIPYSIRFENLSTAGARVQQAIVRDVLATTLDLSTVARVVLMR